MLILGFESHLILEIKKHRKAGCHRLAFLLHFFKEGGDSFGLYLKQKQCSVPLEFVGKAPNSDKESKKGCVYVMNLKRLTYKLQTALLCKGIKVKINQYQSYSEQNKRMITKYVLTVPQQHGEKVKDEKLLESYRLSEVVQKLAELLRGESE